MAINMLNIYSVKPTLQIWPKALNIFLCCIGLIEYFSTQKRGIEKPNESYEPNLMAVSYAHWTGLGLGYERSDFSILIGNGQFFV